jgi:hypothetical protein
MLRPLVGSPESSRAFHGIAYLLRHLPDGTLSKPTVIYSEHTDKNLTTLFGRSVLLVPDGPAFVGWRGTEWWNPEGDGPGYRVYRTD